MTEVTLPKQQAFHHGVHPLAPLGGLVLHPELPHFMLVEGGEPEEADEGEEVELLVLDGRPRHRPPPRRAQPAHRQRRLRTRVAHLRICIYFTSTHNVTK